MALGATLKAASSRRGWKTGGKATAILTAATIGIMGSAALSTTTASADEAAPAPQGCSYGTGGPKADALCWIDFSAFGTVTAAELATADVSKPLTVSLGRYEITMTATVSKGAQGANGLDAHALPTWGGSVLGSTIADQPYFTGVSGRPAFYQRNDADNGVPQSDSERDTITLTGIKVLDTETKESVDSGYSLVVADAESTGTGEGFTWKTDSSWSKYQDVVPAGWSGPCTKVFTGIGTDTVDCSSTKNETTGGRGITMMSADAPTWVSSAFRNETSSDSRQGVAFALVFSTVNSVVEVKQGGESNGEFTVTATTDDTLIGSAKSNGNETESGLQQLLSTPEGTKVTYTVEKTGGTTPDTAYDIVWACTVNGTEVKPAPTGTTVDITVPANGTATCKATATAKPPVTDPKAETINPNQVATLTPETAPGKGAIEKVAFADGSTTKKVDGEGTWTIELVDGKVKSTFTPEKDYTGKVTQQPYTVTDEFGLKASSTLDVTINQPPKTGPDKVTVAQGETATLKPTATKGTGDITKATFDNGETTKKVDGQGTWDIKIEEGQPVATFTPDAGFTGPVTQQPYTVTDTNGLTASSTLDVIIKPLTGDDSAVINPNQTAELKPTTKPGSGDIEKVTFDNGETTKVVGGEGTWTIELVEGQPVAKFTPEKDYLGPVTSQKYTVTDTNALTADGNLSVRINVPPVAKPDAVTINKGETAHLKPATIPGTGPLTGVTFDNGATTKVVGGEGTWTIELVDGKVTAAFVPETGYTGPVTQQKYTVTDTNGLTATSTLDVTILKPAPTPSPKPTPTPTQNPTPTPKPANPGVPSTGADGPQSALAFAGTALLIGGALVTSRLASRQR